MLRSDFFYKFFKSTKNRSNEIIQYNSSQKFILQDQINMEILEIDQKISETSKALIDAQIVKLRSNLSQSNNFIEKFGQNMYKTKLEDSIYWHQKQLKELYLRRRELEIKLDKLKGIFWLNQIKRFVRIILTGFFIFLILFLFLSGFMIIIYLLPIMILIFLGYLIATKRY